MADPLSPPRPTRRRLGHRWLLVFPFIWQACLAPAVNDIALTPFGLPFPMFWQMAGIVLTSVVIAIVFRLDAKAGVEAEEAAFLAHSLKTHEDGAP
ncbi:DUF3311 domain-containing protein [Variovorax sp. 770b2]|uniref:DUF3311 domain-containing protein n=1 Tax=Variovorax sp. 770b2 TaxID=1566271 RepID=UPI0008F25B71|nr:DUF3311 domain-containing protein [Variovorax sp. 770b2]SFP41325.1 Protein of unknown function [Variovorax sp. 770b2]